MFPLLTIPFLYKTRQVPPPQRPRCNPLDRRLLWNYLMFWPGLLPSFLPPPQTLPPPLIHAIHLSIIRPSHSSSPFRQRTTSPRDWVFLHYFVIPPPFSLSLCITKLQVYGYGWMSTWSKYLGSPLYYGPWGSLFAVMHDWDEKWINGWWNGLLLPHNVPFVAKLSTTIQRKGGGARELLMWATKQALHGRKTHAFPYSFVIDSSRIIAHPHLLLRAGQPTNGSSHHGEF